MRLTIQISERGERFEKLFFSEEFLHLVFVHHDLLVGIFSCHRVFDRLYHFDKIPSWANVSGPLSNFRVFRNFSHGLKIDYLISLWTVTFFSIGLNFFNSRRSGVFFLFFWVTYLEVPGMPLVLCSVHSSMIWCLFPFDFFAMMGVDYAFFFSVIPELKPSAFSLTR